MVGYYVFGGVEYGFVYNGTTYTTLAVPGATETIVTGIFGDDVVGTYTVGSTEFAFLIQSPYPNYVPPPPGPPPPPPPGTVPEPSSLILLVVGMAATAGYVGLMTDMQPKPPLPSA